MNIPHWVAPRSLPCTQPQRRWVLLAVAAAVAGCATKRNEAVFDGPVGGGNLMGEGMASWYGADFQGRPTASGEAFDANQLTAAHRSLPFGTRLRVRSRATGREVVVRVNDRGPFARARVIDLSRAAADALGIRQLGVSPVLLLRE